MAINPSNDEFVCPVCAEHHTWRSGIVLPGAPRGVPDVSRVIGWKFCEHHQKQHDDGMVFVVGVNVDAMPEGVPQNPGPSDIVRSGSHCSMPEEIFKELFEGVPISEGRITYAAESVMFALSTIVEAMMRGGPRDGEKH